MIKNTATTTNNKIGIKSIDIKDSMILLLNLWFIVSCHLASNLLRQKVINKQEAQIYHCYIF